METLSAQLSLCVGSGLPSQRATDAELWCFFCYKSKQIIELSLIRDAKTFMRRHRNVHFYPFQRWRWPASPVPSRSSTTRWRTRRARLQTMATPPGVPLIGSMMPADGRIATCPGARLLRPQPLPRRDDVVNCMLLFLLLFVKCFCCLCQREREREKEERERVSEWVWTWAWAWAYRMAGKRGSVKRRMEGERQIERWGEGRREV